jgi:hypothetical protein
MVFNLDHFLNKLEQLGRIVLYFTSILSHSSLNNLWLLQMLYIFNSLPKVQVDNLHSFEHSLQPVFKIS